MFRLRDRLWGEDVILFVYDEAACAALTKGKAKNKIALISVYSSRAIAAPYCVAIWTERAPTRADPADPPSRGGELSPTRDPSVDLASIVELFSMYDLSWMLFQCAD